MNNKILFITEPLYQYSEKIKEAIEHLFQSDIDFFEVYYTGVSNFEDNKNTLWRIVTKMKKNGAEEENKEKQKNFFSSHKNNKYDYILLLLQNRLCYELFEDFISYQKRAKKILYLWDDVARLNDFKRMRGLFDRVVSFDFADCQKYDLEFLPLFYVDDYIYKGEEKIYDFSLIGSLHSDRAEVLDKILKVFPKDRYIWNAKLIAGAESVLLSKLRGNLQFRTPFYICNKGISSSESAEIVKRSKVVIDIPVPGQNGLTMRTIEALAAKAKLITTNENIKIYDFYRNENIKVIDRNNPVVDIDFIKGGYADISDDIVSRYSIREWVKKLFKFGDGK